MNAVAKTITTVQVEMFSRSLYAEALPLLYQHWEEVALYRDTVSLEVDLDFYARLVALDRLLCITVRTGGELVGYAAFFIAPHPHYMSLMTAKNDVIFVNRENRARHALRLIRESERAIRERLKGKKGIIVWHAKLSNDFKPLLERLGYTVNEVTLGKLL